MSNNPIVQFKQTLGSLVDAGEFALPDNVKPEAFKNAAIVAVQENPMILNADQQTLFKSLRRAAAAGLVPDGREGALVLFKTKDKASGSYVDAVQFMPMVFGLIKMVRRSGTVKDIRAHLVYQAEVDQGRFTYTIGDEERLVHEPILFGERGEPVAAYAIATLSDGTIVREFMSAEEIDRVRRAGSSQKVYEKGSAPKVSDKPLGIWAEWSGEMWKKTVIRRLTKRLDMSAEDVRRVMEDPDFEGLRDVTPKQAEPTAFQKKVAEARGEPVEQPKDDVPEAEVVEPHWTEGVDTSDGFPGDDAYTEGVKAAQAGMKRKMCPHEGDEKNAASWLAGFDQAEAAA